MNSEWPRNTDDFRGTLTKIDKISQWQVEERVCAKHAGHFRSLTNKRQDIILIL